MSPGQAKVTQVTIDTEAGSSIGDTYNEARVPVATGPFKRVWNRLASAFTTRQPHTGSSDGDQIETEEHKVQLQVIEHSIEGNHEEDVGFEAERPERSSVHDTTKRQPSQFTSTAFDGIPQPVPVVDVFFGSWWLVSAVRMAIRFVVIYSSTSFATTIVSYGLILILPIYLGRWALLKTGRRTIPLIGVPIPGKRQLFRALFTSVVKIWVRLHFRAS